MSNKIEIIGKHRKSNTKYLVDKKILKSLCGGGIDNCQLNIDNEIDQKIRWLNLEHLFQNITGKGIVTMTANINSKRVVLKAQNISKTIHEFEINAKIKANNLPGFAKYFCKFNCGDDPQNYLATFTSENIASKNICTETGNNMGVIIMKYYSGGSLEDYVEKTVPSKQKVNIVLNIIINVLTNIFDAYLKIYLIHGDLFPKNIVFDSNFKPYIIDFELSSLGKNDREFWKNICDFFDHISRYDPNFKSFDTHMERFILMKRAFCPEPSILILDEFINMIEIYRENVMQ